MWISNIATIIFTTLLQYQFLNFRHNRFTTDFTSFINIYICIYFNLNLLYIFGYFLWWFKFFICNNYYCINLFCKYISICNTNLTIINLMLHYFYILLALIWTKKIFFGVTTEIIRITHRLIRNKIYYLFLRLLN